MKQVKDVISKLKLRHEKALAYVIDTYMPYVKAIAKQILEQPCGNWAVDECINDVFLAVWQNSDKFREVKKN